MHLEQMFLDSKDAYVWIYDPTPWYYWVGGGAIVLITIAVCLFPLWPPWMRLGVHYLSIAAAGFLVFIIALGVVKYIIFALLFALSAGKLRFWIFPNLTEDVGFFESFWPIYDYTYTGTIRSKVPFIYYISTCIAQNLI
jgi:translocation protein SEC62